MKKKVIQWDGKNLPEALKTIPPGQYALEPIDEAPLTDAQEQGIRDALKQLDAGQGRSLAEVISELRASRS